MLAIRARLTRVLRPVRRTILRRRRALAALFAAVAVAGGIQTVTAPPPASVPVLAAARDLPAGEVIRSDDLEPAEFAPGSVPEGIADDAVGRTLAAPLRRGEPVTDVRMVGDALVAGHPDLVAVPVRLPDAGMVGLLTVGDRIDLVGTDPQGEGASTIATDVLVLALPGDVAEATASGPGGRLVVLGVAPGAVTTVSDAAVRFFLTYAFSR